MDWVEKGKAPDVIRAARVVDNHEVRSRPFARIRRWRATAAMAIPMRPRISAASIQLKRQASALGSAARNACFSHSSSVTMRATLARCWVTCARNHDFGSENPSKSVRPADRFVAPPPRDVSRQHRDAIAGQHAALRTVSRYPRR